MCFSPRIRGSIGSAKSAAKRRTWGADCGLDLRPPWKLSRGLESFFLLGRLTLYVLFRAARLKPCQAFSAVGRTFFGVLVDIRRMYIGPQTQLSPNLCQEDF
jgi:hypothetical protein